MKHFARRTYRDIYRTRMIHRTWYKALLHRQFNTNAKYKVRSADQKPAH